MEWTRIFPCIQRGDPYSFGFYRHCIHVLIVSVFCSLFLARERRQQEKCGGVAYEQNEKFGMLGYRICRYMVHIDVVTIMAGSFYAPFPSLLFLNFENEMDSQ